MITQPSPRRQGKSSLILKVCPFRFLPHKVPNFILWCSTLGPRESKYTFLQDSDDQIQGSSAKGTNFLLCLIVSRLLKLLPSWTIGGKGSKARKSTLSKESQPLELKTDKGLVHSATFSTKAPLCSAC